jgi:hypothetical protein
MPWSWLRDIWAFGADLGVEAAWTFVALWTARGLLLWVFTEPAPAPAPAPAAPVNRHHLGQDRGEERLALGGAVDRLPRVGPEGSDAESDGPPPPASDSEASDSSSGGFWTNYVGEAAEFLSN